MRRFWQYPALAVVLALTGLCVWMGADVSGQGAPPPPPPVPAPPQTQSGATTQPVGTGKIAGQVVALDNGAPVKRVTITVMGGTTQTASFRGASSGTPGGSIAPPDGRGAASGPPLGFVQKQKETDASGRFEFTGLPAGRFSVTANVQGSYTRPQAESLQLADGGSATVTFHLERTGAIMGKVFDETGDPLPRAVVRATRWESVGGVRRLVATGSGSNGTDDRGEYRLWDLPAGDYYVSAAYSASNYSPQPSERDEVKYGLAPTYYPGSASMEGARIVTVRAGQDAPGVDINLQRAKMGRIAATAVDTSGSPLSQRGFVMFASRTNSAQGSGGVSRRPDGTWVSGDVPPGDYYVVAQQIIGDGPNAINEGAVVPVSVNGDDVAVSVQLNRGATVSGKVVVEGKLPEATTTLSVDGRPPTQARVVVSARQATNFTNAYMPGTSSGRPEPMRDDGTFELTGLRGTFRLMASGSRAVLKSARQGGRDILETPLELTGTENITDVELVLTTEVGSIDTTVTNAKGEPAAGAYVIIFSDDATRWFEASPYVRQSRTSSGTTGILSSSAATPASGPGTPAANAEPGHVIIRTLIPGRYGVIALESGAGISGPAYDSEALEKVRSRATFVTVATGETATVQLQTVKQ